MRMVQGVLTERSGLKVKVMTEAAAAHFATINESYIETAGVNRELLFKTVYSRPTNTVKDECTSLTGAATYWSTADHLRYLSIYQSTYLHLGYLVSINFAILFKT